jgi:transcriptional regulator with XRE-family HTH domain
MLQFPSVDLTLDAVLATARVRRRTRTPRERRLLREAAGLRRAEVAALLGVAVGSIARYELGLRTRRGELAVQYAALLDRLVAEVATKT